MLTIFGYNILIYFLNFFTAPVYDGKHRVIPSHWSYPDNIVSQPVEMDTEQVVGKVLHNEQIIDLSQSEDGKVSSNFAVKLRVRCFGHSIPPMGAMHYLHLWLR